MGVIERHKLHDRGVQLILVAHRRGAAFEIAHMAAGVRDDESALELPGLGGVDAEVGRQLHRATHALGHVDKGAVRKHRRVEGGEEIIRLRHDGTEILLDQLGMLLHGLGERAENHAGSGEPFLERRRDRDAVEYRIHGHAREPCALVQRHSELCVGLQQLRIDLFETLRTVRLGARRGVVRDRLVIDRGDLHVSPMRLGHLQPVAQRLEPPLRQEGGLVLFTRDQPHDALVQPGRDGVGLDIGHEAMLVAACDQTF